MIIDTHNHVYYQGLSPRDVVDELDRFHIDRCWLLTWHLPPRENMRGYHHGTNPVNLRVDGTHAAMPLRDVIDARDAYPDRFIPGYCPDPLHPHAPALFEAAVRMHGVRVLGEWSYRLSLDDPRAINLFRAAGELGCPVVLHMDVAFLPAPGGGKTALREWVAGDTHALRRALSACPGTVFIGHAPGFWRDISGDGDASPDALPQGPITPGGRVLQLLDEFPNLWADLSAGSGLNMMKRDADFTTRFLARYADRLLYGRDQCGNKLQEFLASLSLPAGVSEKIMFQNALRLVPDR